MTYRAAVLVIHSYLCKISPSSEIAVFWYYRLFYSYSLVYLLPLSYYTFYSCNSILYYCTSTVHTVFDDTRKFVLISRIFVPIFLLPFYIIQYIVSINHIYTTYSIHYHSFYLLLPLYLVYHSLCYLTLPLHIVYHHNFS